VARRGLVTLLLLLLTASAASARAQQRTFMIEGRGWGHGVGMSQWGAEGFALHGWTYREILAHYYPGTRLELVEGGTVRVLLAESLPSVRISSRSAFGVAWRGQTRVRRRALVVTPRTGPIFFTHGGNPLSADGDAYRGELQLFPNGAGVAVVNVVSLERYLRGVVPWEMPHRWRSQALAAQAVAARSYALATLHPRQRFDLIADSRDQEYGGIRAETAPTNRAVGATAGQILSYRGRVALAYYSSTSGGQTAAGGHPYLSSVADPYDSLSPHHRWGPLRFTAHGLAMRLHVPGVAKLTPLVNASGRVSSVRISWGRGGTTLPASTVQSSLGLPSLWFWVRGTRARSSAVPAAPPSDWPAGTAGWTVVLQAVPESTGAAVAKADQEKARLAGLSRVGVLVSDGFSSLRPGYRVVFSGVYASPAAALAAAREAARFYPQAYARYVR
jgi:stage II sporulation protein D